MDEETIRKEFEEWAIDEGFSVDRYIESELYRYTKTQISYAAWLAATRRADRKAREECCEIVRSRKVAIECATEFDKAYNRAVEYLAQAILSTIPEDK